MDIAKIKPVNRKIEILHPGDESEIGLSVTLLSMSDPKLAKLKRNIQDERFALERKGKSFKSDDVETNMNRLAFASIVDWKWSKNAQLHDDKSPELNQKNAYELFRVAPWARDQINAEVGDDAAFFQT